MKTGSITLSCYNTTEVMADVNPEFLVLIIVEAIRNILGSRREFSNEDFIRQLNSGIPTASSEDIFEASVNYLMDVVEENDKEFKADDGEAYNEASSAITDKLNLLISEIDLNNYPSMLNAFETLLFDDRGVNLYHSVSGTFISNKVILCFNPTNSLFNIF